MNPLIVIADPSGGTNAALKRALQIQQQTRAKITLLGFCYANVGKTSDPKTTKLSRKALETRILKKREQELREILKKFGVTAKQVAIKAMWSKDIKQAVLAYCSKNRGAILIKSSSSSNTWLHTSTDWHLIRECPLPFMLTAGKSWKKRARILAAIDFATDVKSKQRLNDKIIAQAKALSLELQQELHVAFAITVPEILADMDLINPRKYASDKRKALEPAIDAFCKKHGIDRNNIYLKQGPAEKVIPSIANKLKVDLVVAGTVGRKGIKGKLLGNTAEAILSNLYTDCLTIHP